MMEKTLLILRLEGALQSWGDHSKWDTRDSGDFPSKSGIVGLLSCALGLERENPEIAELSANLHMAVRADRPGIRMLDFHTVKQYCGFASLVFAGRQFSGGAGFA